MVFLHWLRLTGQGFGRRLYVGPSRSGLDLYVGGLVYVRVD